MRCHSEFWYLLVIPVRKAENVPHMRVGGGGATLKGKDASLILWSIQSVIPFAIVHEKPVAIWSIIEVLHCPLENTLNMMDDQRFRFGRSRTGPAYLGNRTLRDCFDSRRIGIVQADFVRSAERRDCAKSLTDIRVKHGLAKILHKMMERAKFGAFHFGFTTTSMSRAWTQGLIIVEINRPSIG